MIQKINYLITRAFDIIMYPFGFLPDFWGILFLSLLMAFLVLLIYKHISSAKMVKDTKNQIKANILAIRIYKDSWQIILISFFKSLGYTFKYFVLNFGPVLLIIPILFPAFAQMDVRYGMRPFHVDEDIVIKTAYSQNPLDLQIQLEENDHFKPAMNPVFINAFQDEARTKPVRQVSWKLKPTKAGKTTVKIKVGDSVVEKTLTIGDFTAALSKKKYKESNTGHFFYPVEPLLPHSAPVDYIYIKYPSKDISVAGFKIYWIYLNLILVLIFAFAFRKQFGVEF